MRNKILRGVGLILLFVALLMLGTGATALAQSTATLQGTVLDPQGGAVPDAKVTVRNAATGLERNAQSDSSGNFQVTALPVGTYRIEIRREGFQTLVVKEVKLEVDTTVSRNFELKVGQLSQTTEVKSELPVVEGSTMTVGQVINDKTVQEIPLNGRHFVDLGLLIPGSVTPPQNGFLTAPLRGQGSFGLNTAGNREDTINFMINGINLNDMVQNQITFQPSINTVQEFKVDNSTYSAEYGRNSGAIVNIATRSGSNAFHGEAFDFVRNELFDARNFFNPVVDAKGNPVAQSPFKRNQFGTALGGPIWKDQTFFFFSYEGLRQRQGITINSGVLSDAQRATAQTTGNPTVVKLLDLIPHANSGANFVGSATAPVNIDQWTLDIGHNFSEKDRLHGYYVFQRDLRQEPILQGNTIPGFGDTRQSHRQVFTLNESHVFGPRVVNEARLGFNRIHITFMPNAQLNPADFGINNGITSAIGLPQISITTIGLNFGGPSGFPQGRGDTTDVFSDTLSWLRGRHSFKFGGEVRRFYNNNVALDTGTFVFPDVTSFTNGVTADTGGQFSVALGSGSNKIVEGALGVFALDSFKWRSNFTWELGFRYDWNMTPTAAKNRFVVFDQATGSLVQVGSNGGPSLVYHNNNKNFEPRIGFAWDPFGHGRTVVRSAYAIAVEQPITNYVSGLSSNPPFAFPVLLASSAKKPISFANPGIGNLPPNLIPISPSTIDPNFNNAYVQSWNLNVQHEITPSLGIMVGYFGSKGTHLRFAGNLNQPTTLNVPSTEPFPTVSASSPIDPGAPLTAIVQNESRGNSSYNALWITGNKRLSHGLQFNASYTFSHSIDDNSLNTQTVVIQDSNNPGGSRGSSDFDVRHRFVINWIYDLPFKGNRWKEGWQFSAITQYQSGNPLTPVLNITSITGIRRTVRPDLIGPIQYLRDPKNWFVNAVCDLSNSKSNPCPAGAAFQVPVDATGKIWHFGNLGRNSLIGPRFSNTDFSVTKTTKITERMSLQFRTELFDIFNHPNFGNPGLFVAFGSTSFSQITNTRFPGGDFGTSRQAQLALKLLF